MKLSTSICLNTEDGNQLRKHVCRYKEVINIFEVIFGLNHVSGLPSGDPFHAPKPGRDRSVEGILLFG